MHSSPDRKTIFICVYDGDTDKTVLRSGTLERLKQAGHRIVLLIHGGEEHATYYREQFGDEQVLVELLEPASSKLEQIWYYIGWNTLPTRSAAMRRHAWRARGWPLPRFLVGECLGFLGRLRAWRELLRATYRIMPDRFAADLFATYKPDLLFSPNMFSPEDFRLLRQAKRQGVKTITTAKSWDVLTTKAFTRVRADRLIVFNEFNRQEAIDLGDYDASRIVVTGFPQFDVYAHEEAFMSRDEFFHMIGANPQKRLILIAPPGDWLSSNSTYILPELDRRIGAGAFGEDIQVLARYHPKYPDASEAFDYRHVIKDRPGTLLSKKREKSIDMGVTNSISWTFTDTDIARLANSLKHSDIVINTASTLSLDATAVGTPIILLGYDGGKRLPYWETIERVYEKEHFKHVVDTRAAPLVKSDDELEDAIKRFLADPDYLRTERDVLKRELLFKVDGKSTERVVDAILGLLVG